MTAGNKYSRELFYKVMGFEPARRTLKWEFAYWGGALNRWYEEGLKSESMPKEKYVYGDCILGSGDIGNNSPSWSGVLWERDTVIQEMFGLDEGIYEIPYYYWTYPTFEKEIIEEDEGYIELVDNDGIRKKIFSDNSSMPLWLEWPLKDKQDWERLKEERFSLDDISKRYEGSLDTLAEEIKTSGRLRGIFDPPVGFFGSLRMLIGEQNLYLMFYDDPGLLKRILDHLCTIWLLIAEELTSRIDFDLGVFWEDMAYKNGPLISPRTFREFLTPYYKRLIGFLRSKGIKYFSVDCDGNLEELLPLLLDAGINIVYPFERQAGNDLVKYRKRFGKELRMLGGFDKNSLYKGRGFIDEECECLSWLIQQGGFVPFADHAITPNTPWKDFRYYRHMLNSIIDSTRVLD